MPRVEIPLIGPSYTNREKPLSAQVAKNLWPEINPEARNQVALHNVAGTKTFATLEGVDRGMHDFNNLLYVINGQTLYSVDAEGVNYALGTIAGSGRCVMANDSYQLIITTGATPYKYTVAGGVEAITDPDLVNPTTVAYLNNQFIFDQNNGVWGEFVTSSVDPAFSVDALDFAQAESHPDDITAIVAFRQLVYFFGSKSVEPWQNTGKGNPPFARVNSGVQPYGLAGLHGITKTDEFMYFLDTKRIPRRSNGLNFLNIGNPALGVEFAKYSKIDDVIAFDFVQDNQQFVAFTFPAANRTWVFHEPSGSWFQLTNGIGNDRHRASSMIHMYGLNYCADHTNGLLYEYSLDIYSDNGEPIIKQRDTAVIHGGLFGVPGKKLFFDEVEFIIVAGQTEVAGTGLGPQPPDTIPDPPLDLDHLLYYQDFETLKDSQSVNSGYNMLEGLYGYGLNDGSSLVASANVGFATNPSAAGMHGGNAAGCNGTTDNVFSLENEADDAIWTTDEHTQVWWFYVTQIGTLVGLSNSGDMSGNGFNPSGMQNFINADGTISTFIGDYASPSTREEFTTTATVTLDAWNYLTISHEPSTKTLAISLTPDTSGTPVTPEEFTYTVTMSPFANGLLLCGGYNNGVNAPMLSGSRVQHWSLWDYVLPETQASIMFNGGAGLSTPAFFAQNDRWPAQASVGAATTTRPQVELFIPGDWSTYTATSAVPSAVAVTDGDTLQGYRSQHENGAMTGGTIGTPTLKTNIQNGLSVVRVASPSVQAMSAAWSGMSTLSMSVFFAGSCNNANATGVFVALGGFHGRVYANDTGVIGYLNNDGDQVEADAGDAVGSDTFFIGAITYDGVAGEIKVFMNGAKSNEKLTASTGLAGADGGQLFARDNGPNEPFTGDMGHLIAHREALSEEDVISVMDWMNNKWHVYEGWTDDDEYAPQDPIAPPAPDPRTEIMSPFWENTGNWIDLSKLTHTTFEGMFGVAIELADFNKVVAVDMAALTTTQDAGNRIQLQDYVGYDNGALYITDGDGNVLDEMIYSGVPSGDSVLVPTGSNYVVITSDTGNAQVRKWDTTQISTIGSVAWEWFFGVPFELGRHYSNTDKVIPAEGVSLRFTVPVTSLSYELLFVSVGNTTVSSTRTGSVNQTVGDYTSAPSHTWGLGGGISAGVNLSGKDIALVPGETYFFNIRINNPIDNNLLTLQVVNRQV
ncbi:MAG: packaged DNA stabilization protein gp10 [Bacteroidales bacterium]|nr:packaged DNA stabilization protein gp10 [Candidatus Latescibacterota bacterium]